MKEPLDFHKILPKASMLVNEEILMEFLVEIIHGIEYWDRQDGTVLNLNLFRAVLLLLKPTNYCKSKNYKHK